MSPQEETVNATDIHFILKHALRAPSGDNTQPWHWIVHGNTLELWHTEPEGFIPTLFWKNKKAQDSTYLAFGTMIENLTIAASERKYRVIVSYFSDVQNPLHVATVVLTHDESIPTDSLIEALPKRMTSREPFTKTPLLPKDRAALLHTVHEGCVHGMQLVESQETQNMLLQFITHYDELLFGNKYLHERFFSLISWTKKRDQERRIGFHASSLGASTFSLIGLRLLGLWWITYIGTFFGLPKFIASGQRALYRQSSAFGVIYTQGDSVEDWINAGRLTERIWLTANNCGLSFQPMNGALLLTSIARSKEAELILPPHTEKQLIEDYEELLKIFAIEGTTINFIFRIGYNHQRTPTSLRRKFEDMVDIIDGTKN